MEKSTGHAANPHHNSFCKNRIGTIPEPFRRSQLSMNCPCMNGQSKLVGRAVWARRALPTLAICAWTFADVRPFLGHGFPVDRISRRRGGGWSDLHRQIRQQHPGGQALLGTPLRRRARGLPPARLGRGGLLTTTRTVGVLPSRNVPRARAAWPGRVLGLQ